MFSFCKIAGENENCEREGSMTIIMTIEWYADSTPFSQYWYSRKPPRVEA